MDEFAGKMAGIGLPAVILLVTMSTTGLAGAAAITAALAMLGPGGMVGGVILLGVVGLAADMLAKHGLQALLIEVYRKRRFNGESVTRLINEINKLPISKELKLVLRDALS